ncbi:hypothetical protein V1294_002368 [Bradyrhizobium sp. AZCC 1678]|jgi:hypothetical protein|uniref:hypothetical protein n=1 Tax=Bradyrhizobium sp. AZCC 1678 TaxID=3117030 RepID=UPI002FF182B8
MAIDVSIDRDSGYGLILGCATATYLPSFSWPFLPLQLFRRDPFVRLWSLSNFSQNPLLRPEIDEATLAFPGS